MWKRLNSNQMCEQFSYKEVSYREILLYIYIYIYIYIYTLYTQRDNKEQDILPDQSSIEGDNNSDNDIQGSDPDVQQGEEVDHIDNEALEDIAVLWCQQ